MMSLEEMFRSLAVPGLDADGEADAETLRENARLDKGRVRHGSGYLVAFASSIVLWIGILACVLGVLAKVFR